ncbi:BAG family molecular chaperone regulator 4 isoform X2 [Denticeps clupeoides]|uniref:BAG family molecular chaperone regulator 4 isoform X2 n=1 Tax=Denticeps clupeoides TaxID=299321 RepID=UPI0010A35FD9|nr:BAG family molecular chaperone regulator 4 isoform X2 [Denticeps clupeoides]
MNQTQPNSKPAQHQAWPSTYSPENNNWNGAMDSVQYPGYASNYWYPQSPATGPYGNMYPPATEVNGQLPYSPQAFPNGVYSPAQYAAGMVHPSSPYYCTDQMTPRQPQYHNQGCPEHSTGATNPPPYPAQSCQGGPGYPPPSYQHYGEGGPTLPPNAPYPTQQSSRHPTEAWPHPGYGPPHQQWQPSSQSSHTQYGNHVRPPHPPPWQGPAPPPYEPKDHQPGQSHPRPLPTGPKPQTGTSNSATMKGADFSAPPQIYKAGGAKGEGPSATAPTPLASTQLSGLARVYQVLTRVELLQEDVDEFVGKKTDKSYRCLEELLTKELLELDSVETNGQEEVRQARKEAVQRIQGILDSLERKAF